MQCHLRGELMEQIFNLIGRQILDAEKTNKIQKKLLQRVCYQVKFKAMWLPFYFFNIYYYYYILL